MVADYVVCWRSGLNKLASAGHLFDHADTLWHFVNHLPFGSTYNIICKSVLYGLSTACFSKQLPSFESVFEHVMNIDLNHAYFQPPRSCYPNSDPTSTTTTPTPTSNEPITTLSTNPSSTNNTTQHHPPHSTNGGGQEGNFMNRNKPPAHAYLREVDVDLVVDGGVVAVDQHSPSTPSPLDKGATLSFTTFGTTSFVPTPVNDNVFFDAYQTGVISISLSSIYELSPVRLSSISEIYNSILDSGCTNHIIQDHSLFWTYHTSLAVPVKL